MIYNKKRENDIPYLGVREEKIKSANPILNKEYLKLYYHYIIERQEIFKKKESGLTSNLTDDPILKKYRFTNMKRWQDRVSRWLIDNIINTSLSLEEKVWRIVLFRMYNRTDTAEEVFNSFKDLSFDGEYSLFWNNEKRFYEKIMRIDHDAFTRAYKSYGMRIYLNKKYPDYDYKICPFLAIRDIRNEQKTPKFLENSRYSSEDVIKWLVSLPGIGNFVAQQILIDFTYMSDFKLSETEFIIAGPGCKQGINLICENMDDLTYEEFIFWQRDNQDKFFSLIGKNSPYRHMFDERYEEADRSMTLACIQNSYCEFSKYIHYMNGTYKKPRYYKGDGK